MENRSCKPCSRNFANGRALGGHMRSHMMNFYSSKNASSNKETDSFQSSHSYSSPSSSSSSEEESEEVKELLSYRLREKPKKTTFLADQECAFTAGSTVLRDGESETESPKQNPFSKRSKRVRKSRVSYSSMDDIFRVKKSKPPLISSISDTTPEEDVAYCLMMLSRDKWRKEKKAGDDYSELVSLKVIKKNAKVGGKYRCETCRKLFRSYQALGGHRASHNRIKANGTAAEVVVEEGKLHECPFCERVFSSGQALVGHKKTHFIGAAAISANVNATIGPVKTISRIGETLDIDLNLPAADDDEW